MRFATLYLSILLAVAPPVIAQRTAASSRAEIEIFNRNFAAATRAMDATAILALWDDDGVSLLPSTKPIIGKKAIASFLSDVMATLSGAHMTKFESTCFDVNLSGDWASEWCTEHQLVALTGGKPPFDGYGKMLLILHRNGAGTWLLREEMWNQALAPDTIAR